MLAWTLWDVLARNWAIVAIASTVVALVAVPAIVLLRYIRISLNILRSTKPPLTRNPLDYEALTGEPVSFPAADGLRLSGMIIRANRRVPRRGLILFAHEYCSDQQSCARYCRPLQQVGYDILTFDFRGHGLSASSPGYTPRQWVTNREMDDIRGALAFIDGWLSEQKLPREVGIFGISRGACAGLLAAAESPRIVAIFSDGAFSTDTTLEHLMKRWAYIFANNKVLIDNYHPCFWRFMRAAMLFFAARDFRCTFPSVRKAITRMTPRPIFFTHGEKDSYLPVEQARRLYVLAPQPKSLWIAPGARHNQAAVLHPERYAELTIGFFDQHLAQRTAEPAALPAPRSRPAVSPSISDESATSSEEINSDDAPAAGS